MSNFYIGKPIAVRDELTGEIITGTIRHIEPDEDTGVGYLYITADEDVLNQYKFTMITGSTFVYYDIVSSESTQIMEE